MKEKIVINSETYEHEGGLVRAEELYEIAGCQDERLFINRPDDIDIPLDPADVLVIQDGASFVTGKATTESNPTLRREIQLRFNGEDGPSIAQAKITGRKLKEFDAEHPKGRLFIDISTSPDAEIADDMTVVVHEGISFFVIPADDDTKSGGPIDIEGCARHGRRPPKGLEYRIRIDREKYLVKRDRITGAQILERAGKSPEDWALNQKIRGGERRRIKPDDVVDIAKPGIERFETVRRQAQQGCV
ncbi:MAG: multiubiquitin domain-containing protein [Rhodobacteraceae bacterium]|nr:multiubiquitin domain-containing protein [Paracoccaceae bacterium]MCY4326145.1 multiubiquitin domain-containing protein [Paracoccaceae bacterium]